MRKRATAAAAGHLRRAAGTAVGAARALRVGRRALLAIAEATLALAPAPAIASRVRPLGRQPPEHGQLLPRGELAELADTVRPVSLRRCWRGLEQGTCPFRQDAVSSTGGTGALLCRPTDRPRYPRKYHLGSCGKALCPCGYRCICPARPWRQSPLLQRSHEEFWISASRPSWWP